jgi:hypothetical protein
VIEQGRGYILWFADKSPTPTLSEVGPCFFRNGYPAHGAVFNGIERKEVVAAAMFSNPGSMAVLRGFLSIIPPYPFLYSPERLPYHGRDLPLTDKKETI